MCNGADAGERHGVRHVVGLVGAQRVNRAVRGGGQDVARGVKVQAGDFKINALLGDLDKAYKRAISLHQDKLIALIRTDEQGSSHQQLMDGIDQLETRFQAMSERLERLERSALPESTEP